jgi:methyl-accepting chemotaxis protein
MEEMTSTVKQNAENAGQASRLALAARTQAEKGGAVVATEVRNLAGRSAAAAKEIKALIQDTVRKVDEGSNLVTQSGSTLEQLVVAVKKVTDIVSEIAAASHEQSSGIEQVNKAVMQLDELTQQNAALVEEASAASQAMADQARGLNSSMQRYSVNGSMKSEAADRGSQPDVHGKAAQGSAKPVERRSAKRPWSGKAATPAAESVMEVAAAPAKRAANSDDESTWKEF